MPGRHPKPAVYIEMMRLLEPPTLRLPRTARSFYRPVAVSAALHLAVIALLIWETSRPPGSPPGLPGAPGLGNQASEPRVTYLALPAYRAPAPPDQTRRQRPTPRSPVQVEVLDVAITSSVADVVQMTALPGALRGGGGVGTGSAPGAGGVPGTGSGAAGAGLVFPPQARFSILPPLPSPAAVRGKSYRVRFWVSATGRVTKVEVNPPIPDAEYRKQFIQLMSQYTFTPAMRPDGTPVAGETTVTITL